jgi:quinohemoprotein ethanol dehydrogenase
MKYMFLAAVLVCSKGALAQSPLPAGAGRVALVKVCATCHSPEIVAGMAKNKEDWKALVSEMATKGAEGTDQEFKLIVDYLATNFPDKSNVSKATARQLETVSDLSQKDANVVNDAALRDAGRSGEEWITYNASWSEQRYSPLSQINATNINRIGPAWYADIPATPGPPQNRQEATPLMFHGRLYSIAPWSVVYALDARTGKEIWRQDPGVNKQIWQSRICCGVVNRGISLYKGKIIAPVVDGRLRALDAESGRVLWETRVSPENVPQTITMAPRVIKGGKVIIGLSGGEYGVRGFFDAYDSETGKREWRFYTVPGDPSKPFEQPELEMAAKTWSSTHEWWKIGGGTGVWNGFAYDPDDDIVYVGTGQPEPWNEVTRGPGDNLFADCILAVRGASGKLIWYYQEVPGDDWDFDAVSDLMLADLTINGKPRQVIMHAPKDGFFYVLDRHTGELLSADPFVTVTWATGVNLKTGRPTVNPEARYTTDSVSVMPSNLGATNWPPWSYNPATGLVYIRSTIGGAHTYKGDPNFTPAPIQLGPNDRAPRNEGMMRTAGHVPPPLPAIGPQGQGNVLIAWDPVAQKERWRGLASGYNNGGTLSTGGNLVFSVVNNRLLAYRADNGQQLLDLDIGLWWMGPPMTFMLDGTQYIAIAGGPLGVSGQTEHQPPAEGQPKDAPVERTTPAGVSHLLVLKLDGKASLPASK